jgi:hypothetical protein
VREAARPTATQDQADRLAGEQPGEALEIGLLVPLRTWWI